MKQNLTKNVFYLINNSRAIIFKKSKMNSIYHRKTKKISPKLYFIFGLAYFYKKFTIN